MTTHSTRSIARILPAARALLLACALHVAGANSATTIAPGVHLIPGATPAGVQPDGNSVLIEAPEGLIVFDTGRHAAHTQQIIDFADAARRPIRSIINSHWHLDHVGGNVMLRDRYPAVRIYASPAIRQALDGFLADYHRQLLSAAAGQPAGSQGELRAEIALIDAGPQLLPTDEILQSGDRNVAGRRLEFHLEPGAVTAGDVWVFDARTRIVLAGDLVTLPAPFLDTACPSRWQLSLSHLDSKAFRLLVPGHGPALRPPQLHIYRSAFDHLIACAASDRPKADCIDGWVQDSASLVPEGGAYERALLDYYVDKVLRNNPAALAGHCASALETRPAAL